MLRIRFHLAPAEKVQGESRLLVTLLDMCILAEWPFISHGHIMLWARPTSGLPIGRICSVQTGPAGRPGDTRRALSRQAPPPPPGPGRGLVKARKMVALAGRS